MKQFVLILFLVAAALNTSLQAQNTFSVRVANGNDDAEEELSAGTIYLTSSDLELVYDSFVSDDQIIGLRFNGISLPANATVVNAYLQFEVDELKTVNPCSLNIYVEDNVTPSTYNTIGFDISGRTYINDSVAWNPGAWLAVDDQGPAQRTPDIKSLVDSILNKSGWVNGNSMAFMIKGTGTRTAEAFDGEPNSAPQLVIEYSLPGQFLLQVLHASDLEGGVDAIVDAPAFAAIMAKLEGEYPNSLSISSGDNYIPGPFFNASSESSVRDSLRAILSDFYGSPLNSLGTARGRIDVSIMNVIGFNASVFGNHEFDMGEGGVADIILGSGNASALSWMGAQFPYLSANLDFSASFLNNSRTANVLDASSFVVDVTNPASANNTPKIAPATIITVNGEEIGVVGATTQLLSQITSAGNVSVVGSPSMNDMPQLAAVLQPYIDSLTARGVNKIIVATHLQQFALEQALAGLLNDVDIILAGGSDFLLADNNDVLRPGDAAAGVYPFQTLNAQNDSVLIVSTDGEYSYVGRLVVAFDANGKLLPSSVSETVSGAYASIPSVVNSLYGSNDPYAIGSKAYFVERLVNSVSDIVVAKDGNVFGKSAVFLEGRREFVRTEETNMGNITADANLWIARQFDPNVAVSLKNGGGIRAEIGFIDQMNSQLLPPQPNPVANKDSLEVSQLDIENTLRFNNALKVVETTPGGLKDLLEHGISNWDGVSTNGQMPQVGGIKFSFDPSLAAGSRIQNMAVVDTNGSVVDSLVVNSAISGDASRVIKLVSLNFLVDNDGDGYPFSTTTSNGTDLDSSTVNVNGGANFAAVGTEQDALAEYFLTKFSSNPFADDDVDASLDERIQILSLRNDSVFRSNIGLNQYNAMTEVSIYPIPSHGKLTIESKGANLKQIEVLSLNGQVLRTFKASEQKLVLDLSSLNPGLYLVKVETNYSSTLARLMLN
jgi:2',3'-cyclic-nucleotide 2'-phosphodiesterase (5'-nucleotidase family)